MNKECEDVLTEEMSKIKVDFKFYEEFNQLAEKSEKKWTALGQIQDLTKGGSDKRPPKAVVPRGVRGHAPPENF